MSPNKVTEFELDEEQHTGTIKLPNYHLLVQLNKTQAPTIPIKHTGSSNIDYCHGKREYELMREIAESLLEIEGIKNPSKRSQLYDLGFSINHQKFFRSVRSDEVRTDINKILREAARLKRLDEVCSNGLSLTKKVEIRAKLELLGIKSKQYYDRESIRSPNNPDHELEPSVIVSFHNDLFNKMISTHNTSELKTLCFNIGLQDDELSGQSRSEIAREMIKIMGRLSSLQLLIDKLRETRPEIDWPDL